MKKDKYKIIIWIIVAIFVLIIYSFIRDYLEEQNKLSYIDLSNQLTISDKYNYVLQNIHSKEEIWKCDKILDKIHSDLCKATINDRYAPERKFTNISECDKLYKDNNKKLINCKYNVALSNINNKEEIWKCDKIWDAIYIDLCKATIKDRFK